MWRHTGREREKERKRNREIERETAQRFFISIFTNEKISTSPPFSSNNNNRQW